MACQQESQPLANQGNYAAVHPTAPEGTLESRTNDRGGPVTFCNLTTWQSKASSEIEGMTSSFAASYASTHAESLSNAATTVS